MDEVGLPAAGLLKSDFAVDAVRLAVVFACELGPVPDQEAG